MTTRRTLLAYVLKCFLTSSDLYSYENWKLTQKFLKQAIQEQEILRVIEIQSQKLSY